MQKPIYKGPKPRNLGSSFTVTSGRASSSSNWRQGRGGAYTSAHVSNGGRWKQKPRRFPNKPTLPFQQVSPTPSTLPARPPPLALPTRHSHASHYDEGQVQRKALDREQTRKRTQHDRDAMWRYLEKNNPRRQYNFNGWDVKVVCDPFVWYLHKNIMRKCRFFSSFLPVSEEDDLSKSVIVLHSHCPGQLANVIRFMYFFDYPGAVYDHHQPLYGDSLLTNTAMYVAGASVGHQGMMTFATRNIDAWVEAVLTPSSSGEGKETDPAGRSESPLCQALRGYNKMDYAILRLAVPLHRSLAIVYEQPLPVRAGPLFELRLTLIRFVSAALPYLAVNAAFRAHFRNEWDRPLVLSSLESENEKIQGRSIVDSIIVDHAMFSDLGFMRPRDGPAVAAASYARKSGQLSVVRTFVLLQRLSRNERSWISATSGARDGDGDGDGNGENTVTETEADQQYRQLYWEASLSDHEKALGELVHGLDSIIAG